MDYTKVLTDLKRISSALAKKLDAIKTDVTNVNNSVTNLPTTLDTKFSALTSKVDGVKTDVASVGANVTAMGAKVDSATKYTGLPQSVVVLTDNAFGGRKEVVNVQGAGELELALWRDTHEESLCVEIFIDGKLVLKTRPHEPSHVASGNDAAGFIASSNILGVSTGQNGYLRLYAIPVIRNSIYTTGCFMQVTSVCQLGLEASQKGLCIAPKSLRFDKSLSIFITRGDLGPSNPTLMFDAVYTLDQ